MPLVLSARPSTPKVVPLAAWARTRHTVAGRAVGTGPAPQGSASDGCSQPADAATRNARGLAKYAITIAAGGAHDAIDAATAGAGGLGEESRVAGCYPGNRPAAAGVVTHTSAVASFSPGRPAAPMSGHTLRWRLAGDPYRHTSTVRPGCGADPDLQVAVAAAVENRRVITSAMLPSCTLNNPSVTATDACSSYAAEGHLLTPAWRRRRWRSAAYSCRSTARRPGWSTAPGS